MFVAHRQYHARYQLGNEAALLVTKIFFTLLTSLRYYNLGKQLTRAVCEVSGALFVHLKDRSRY